MFRSNENNNFTCDVYDNNMDNVFSYLREIADEERAFLPMMLNSPPSATTSRSFSLALNSPLPTTQDSRMHPFVPYVSPQVSVNISTEYSKFPYVSICSLRFSSISTNFSHLLLSPNAAEINSNVRNFNLIINNITSSLTIGLSSHIIAFS